MGCVVALIALIFPRILIAVLWLFTEWFSGVYNGILVPLLGFLFLPVTTLWYSVVVNMMGGQWSILAIIGMVVAIAIDLGSLGGGYRSRKRY